MARIGIIGLGFMGRMHATACLNVPEAQLVAVADRKPHRAAGDLTDSWGNIPGTIDHLPMEGIRGVTDYRELLSMDDVDVVDVCVATPAHTEVVAAALDAGKHVICEKPLAVTSDEARQLADKAADAKRMLMPAMCIRYWPHWVWLKRAIEEGSYGRVLGAGFRRVASLPPGWFRDGKSSGGGLIDLHIHDTDFVLHAFGSPKQVFSRGYQKSTGATDHVVTHYLYDDVPLVFGEGGWAMADGFDFNMAYTVNFEHATADFNIGRDPVLWLIRNGEKEAVQLDSDGYMEEIRAFAKSVDEGRPPSAVSADDAVRSLEIAEAEQKSIETGQPVSLAAAK